MPPAQSLKSVFKWENQRVGNIPQLSGRTREFRHSTHMRRLDMMASTRIPHAVPEGVTAGSPGSLASWPNLIWLVPNHLKKQGGHRLIKWNNFYLTNVKSRGREGSKQAGFSFSLWPFSKSLAKCMVGGILRTNKSSFSALSGPPSPWGPAHVHGI